MLGWYGAFECDSQLVKFPNDFRVREFYSISIPKTFSIEFKRIFNRQQKSSFSLLSWHWVRVWVYTPEVGELCTLHFKRSYVSFRARANAKNNDLNSKCFILRACFVRVQIQWNYSKCTNSICRISFEFHKRVIFFSLKKHSPKWIVLLRIALGKKFTFGFFWTYTTLITHSRNTECRQKIVSEHLINITNCII